MIQPTPDPTTAYAWTIVFRERVMGFGKTEQVHATTIETALDLARANITARGYDAARFDITNVSRGQLL